MQAILHAGLSKTLVTTVMRTQDSESFLAAAEALLVMEPISSEKASLLWDEAAVKIGARQVRSVRVQRSLHWSRSRP